MKATIHFQRAVPYFFLFLFVYTAFDKLTDHHTFERILSHSDLIGSAAPYISWLVPLTELIITVLLLFPQTQAKGITASLVLMLGFTAYILYMIASGSKLPCHCGGVISQLTWKQHILFNTGCILLATVALYPPLLSYGTVKTRLYKFTRPFIQFIKSKAMRKIMFGLLVAVTAAGASAFTNAPSKRAGIQAGVLSVGSDAGGTYYNVEHWGTTRSSCEETSPSDVCSFDFNNASLPSKIYSSDPRINNMVTGATYQ